MTPAEIVAYRPQTTRRDTPGWSVRAIPNQFAALRIEGKFDRRGEGLYDMMNGVGAHEVIIESPMHNAAFGDYPLAKIEEILAMYRHRMQDLMRDQRFRHIQIFRNYGELAGASVPHPHSQVVALPMTPVPVREELQHAYDYWNLKERCIFCDMISQDTQSERVIFANHEFVSLEPFAARHAFETWIFPKEHTSSYHTISDSALTSLAEALKYSMMSIDQAMARPPFNLVLHTAPVQPEKAYHSSNAKVTDHYHWHIELIPRAMRAGGFQFGTGIHVNPVLPENAAEYLRTVIDEIRHSEAVAAAGV